MVVAFGTMFNNIRLVRYDKAGTTEIERITVPLSYADKEKFYRRITQDPELTKEVAITLPRMGFTLDSITYDPLRKTSLFNNNFAANPTTGNLIQNLKDKSDNSLISSKFSIGDLSSLTQPCFSHFLQYVIIQFII